MKDYSEILARYKQMRGVSRDLNSSLIECISTRTLEAAAKELGLFQGGRIVFYDEDESCILFDHAIYDGWENGLNTIDRYMVAHSPAPGSDQEAVLTAMKHAFFSLFQVRDVIKSIGVTAHDMIRDRIHLLVDVGLSQSAPKGLVLASRVLPFDKFVMTTGAALTAAKNVLDEVFDYLDGEGKSPEEMQNLSREEWAELAAMATGLCLDNQDDVRIKYRDVPQDE